MSNEKHDLKKSKNEIFNTYRRKMEDVILSLSEDMKEYQRKLKLLGPQNKIVQVVNKRILSKLSENNYEIIQLILNKKKRTNDDLNIVKTFLSTMKYLSSMIKILDIDKILFSLSMYLKMEKKSKDSILFRFGSIGRKFYILLSGQVTILILKETSVEISFMKFIMHLIMLKILGEDETVKKIIIANHRNKNHLDENTFNNLYERVSLMGIKKIEKKNKNKKIEVEVNEEEEEESENESIEDIKIKTKKEKSDIDNKNQKTLQLNYLVSNFNGFLNSKNYRYKKTSFKNENMENYDLPKVKRPSNKSSIKASRKSVVFHKNDYMQDFPFFHKEDEINELVSYYVYLIDTIGNIKKHKFSVSNYIQDTYINSSYEKKLSEKYDIDKEKYIIYKYLEISQKNKGETFGELALQHEDSKRTATIITNTDCILGYLSKSAYQTCLSEIELKRRKNEVNFIMSFAIFDQMNWISFENKYFNYFKREYFSHMEQIIQQGDEIKKIFFIMSGQFEITTSLSIGEIYRIIKQKRNDALDNYNIRLNKNKYKIRLSICNNKDIVGLNDCCYNKNNGEEVSFVNVTCISSNSVVFTLDKNILNGLKNKISEINDNLIEIINRREKVVVDRLITNFNTLLKKREIDIKEKLGILPTTNKSMTSKKKLIIGKDSLVNKFKKENNEIIINGDKLPPNMRRLYSANYKQIRPLSKNSYINKKSSDETMIMNNSNRIKSTTMSSKNGISKLNSEKINLTNNYASLSINKDSNTMFKGNLQKQTSKIDEDNKGNINNIYPYINNMASNEYNKLSNFGENMNNISEKQKSNYMNEENRKKTEGYINNNKDGNKINKYQQTDSNKLFENESLILINKDNIMIKNKISNKLSRKKNINFFTQDNNNIINEKFIKNTSLKSNNEENKINNNDYFVPIEKNRFKAKLISNESYLKQILGNRYRSEDDEFITYEEKKFIKTIKDFNTNLLNISKMKLKFKEKMKKKFNK